MSKKLVFESKYYSIYRTVIERGGKKITKDMIEWSPSVFVLPLTEDMEIYLEYQYRDSYKRDLLEIVAGHIEPDEDVLEGAKREMEEETGLTAKKWYKMGVIHSSPNIKADIHVFVATDLSEGEQKLDEDEDLRIVKMPFAEAIEKVMNGEMEIGTHMWALLKLEKLIKEKKIEL